jgi:hypothetical protein
MAVKLTLSSGREFALVTPSSKRLPKRFAGEVTLIVDGVAVKCPVTNNRAWCGTAADSLEYIWLETKEGAKYATMSYGEPAATLAGETASVLDGAGPKPVARKTGTADAGLREWNREEAFKATWAAK